MSDEIIISCSYFVGQDGAEYDGSEPNKVYSVIKKNTLHFYVGINGHSEEVFLVDKSPKKEDIVKRRVESLLFVPRFSVDKKIRKIDVVYARMIIAYILWRESSGRISLENLGKVFTENKDHSTVLHWFRKINEAIDGKDNEFLNRFLFVLEKFGLDCVAYKANKNKG